MSPIIDELMKEFTLEQILNSALEIQRRDEEGKQDDN